MAVIMSYLPRNSQTTSPGTCRLSRPHSRLVSDSAHLNSIPIASKPYRIQHTRPNTAHTSPRAASSTAALPWRIGQVPDLVFAVWVLRCVEVLVPCLHAKCASVDTKQQLSLIFERTATPSCAAKDRVCTSCGHACALICNSMHRNYSTDRLLVQNCSADLCDINTTEEAKVCPTFADHPVALAIWLPSVVLTFGAALPSDPL